MQFRLDRTRLRLTINCFGVSCFVSDLSKLQAAARRHSRNMMADEVPAPLADPELVKRITMLAERVAKKPDFESTMREKQGAHPDWAFLNGGEGADFYESEKLHHQQLLAAQMREQFAAAPPDLARPDLIVRPPPGSTGYPVPPPGPRPPPGPLPAYGVSAGYGGPSPGNGGSAPSYGGGGGGGRSGYRRADDGMGRVDEARVEQLLVEREGYRRQRDYENGDRVKVSLTAMGVRIDDKEKTWSLSGGGGGGGGGSGSV